MRMRTVLTSCCVAAMAAVSARGAEFVLQPISASGTYTIVGREIQLTGGGQRVVMEVQLKDWAPRVLKTYQAQLNSAGYSSGASGTLAPAIQSCPALGSTGNNACAASFGDAGTRCLDFDPGPAVLLQCEPAWINRFRTDWAFFGLDVAAVATDISTLNYRWGAAVFPGSEAVDDGTTRYGGRVMVDVPTDAVGTFTIGFIPGEAISFMQDENNELINPLLLTPGKITVLCTSSSQCDDDNACTDDTCNAEGTCLNTPNYNTSTQCCNPATGQLTTISDGNPCTDDVCNTTTGAVTHPNSASGTACGSQSSSQCDLPDSCNGAGQCLTNLLPSGTPCGSTENTECNGADTCDAAGVCQNNIRPAGTPCGDPSSGPCDSPDSCNGAGACLSNNVTNNTPCSDGLFCTVNERCQTGVCTGGSPRNCDDQLTCTTDSCNEDTDACDSILQSDRCLIDGACYSSGDLREGNTCEACDPPASGTSWTVLPDETLCNDGNACTGTGRPGIGFDTCTAGVCAGVVDPECNDQCEYAVPVVVGENISDNSGAGVDDGEASCQIDSNHDVWFEYTASCDGVTFMSTTGSALIPSNDTVLSVYDSCPTLGGTELVCDDDSGVGLQSALYLPTMTGTTYLIRVAGYGENKGPILLTIRPADDCLIDEVCYARGDLNPTNDCLACIPEISTTQWSPRAEGSTCGDPQDTECDSPDACDGAGVCEVNYKPDNTPCSDEVPGNECTQDFCIAGFCSHPPEPVGLACGDPTDTECDNPDSCDGAGTCQDNLEGAGFACGDPSSSQCDRPDTCNGLGVCLLRHMIDGTPCDDGDVCTGSDHCETGVCVATPIPEAPLVEAMSGRHLAVTPQPEGSSAPVALRVTSPDWPCLLRYVDEDGKLVAPADKVFQLPEDWATIIVQDPDIVPSTTYVVEAECGVYLSAPGSDDTWLWGDVNNDGIVDFTDVSLLVDAFKGFFLVVTIQAVDLAPCEPNNLIDMIDVSNVVNAFKGYPYPCSLPCHD